MAGATRLFDRWKKSPLRFEYIIAGLLAITLGLHLYMSFFPFEICGGNDARHHLAWIEEFIRMRKQGVTYPRWLPDSNGGFGSTSFYFYPPLTYFLAEFLNVVVSDDPTILYHAVQLTALVGCFVFAYAYFHYHFSDRLHCGLAAMTFAIGPYHLYDLFIRNALAEHVSLMWIPLLLLSVDFIIDTRRKNGVESLALGAACWAGLVLTNLPVTIIMITIMPVYALTRTAPQCRQRLWMVLGSGILGITISLIYVLPVIEMKAYLSEAHLFNFFPTVRSYLLEDDFKTNIVHSGIHAVGTVTILTAACVCILMWKDRRRLDVQRALLYTLMLALFMQTPWLSRPVWDWIAPLKYIQFSWRYCTVLLLAPAVAVVSTLSKKQRSWSLAAVTLYLLFGIGWYAHYLIAVHSNPWPQSVLVESRPSPPEHVPIFAMMMDPTEIDVFARDHMHDPPVVFAHKSVNAVSLLESSPTHKRFVINSTVPDTLHLHQFYWPYWKLTVRASQIQTFPGEHGLSCAVMPVGSYTADLQLEHSSGEVWGAIGSECGAGILLALLGSVVIRRFRVR